ncbi:MAG: phospholipase D-like domain-containing protein, partial [Marinoscillum sp.]
MSSLVPERAGGYNGASVSTDQIKQRTISNNQEIFETITSQLEKATSEILVVAAWFTDDTLLHILKTKAEEGLTVQIIVSDNEDNRKLDFDSFPDATANVLKVKNVGYGMMHQKYCVIDRITAIHGSYNWTVNAKKNNQESVIITNHKQTVDELILNFEDIKNRLEEIEEHGLSNSRAIKDHFKNNPDELVIPEREELSKQPIQEVIEERKRQYEEVLDTMIAAEVSHYDRSEIASQGYQRAKSTNGDHQVLPNAFDSVYSAFIAGIDALEDKKNRLLNRIEEQRAKNIQALEAKEELEINSVMVKYETKHQVLSSQITNTKSQIALNEAQVEKLEAQDVHQIETRIAAIKEEVNTEEREFIRPRLKWFELLPAIVINLGLFFYLVLFYSSAAYILMFSELDAKEAKMNGVSILPPEVFNPNALSMAVDKGGTAIPFVLLFVFVPMTLSIIGKLLGTKRIWNTVVIFTGVIVVDAFIAYVVSKSIHEV